MGLVNGKVALVTGAASGIGQGIALRLAAEGAAVGVLDRDEPGCRKTAESIALQKGEAVPIQADVSCARDVSAAVERLVQTLGPPSILIHAAGIMPTGTIEETLEDDWDRVFAVNAKGAFLLCKEVLPVMRKAGGGSIILVASLTGVLGYPGLAAYSGTKGALISLARAMAIDYAREGIRVNSVSPGTIDSPMLHQFVAQQSDPARTRAAFDAVQPRGRVGTIDEVANAVVFLASDQASLINGANICLDGAASVKGDQPRL
jgi:NAD(P)-dependent dehydrogenase (short-subunit alcohol dehydrogenase family)